MSGNNNTALLDSNILIYVSKSLLNIRELLEPYQNVYISSITYMEVLGYKFENRKLNKLT